MGSMVVNDLGEWTPSWPWPQVKFLQHYVLGFAPIGDVLWLYELRIVDTSWVATPVMALGSKDGSPLINIADFGMFITLSVYWAEGDVLSCWVRNPGVAPDVVGAYSELPTVNAPKFIAACNFNGQCIIGGVETDDASWSDLEFHSVAWSAIGSFNFRAQDKATAGYAKSPFGQSGEGKVWKVLQLDKLVVLYSNVGTAAMIPISTPAVGWSVNDKGIGLPAISPDCIDGGIHKHGMIDRNYEFHILTKDGSQKLGFKEFLEPLFLSSPVRVIYEKSKDRFYISNGLKSYVLNSKGKLYECHQCVSSIGYFRGILCGFFYDTGDYEARLFLNSYDFGIRAIKKLSVVEAGFQGTHSPMCMARWRLGSENFSDGVWKAFNTYGVVFPIVSGVDLMIGIKIEDYRESDFSIDYLNVRLQLSDKRFMRGNYALD